MISPGWYAVETKSNQEFTVDRILRVKGYEVLLPSYETHSTGRALKRALFPGYLFCRIGANTSANVVTSPGVRRLVGFGGKYLPVDLVEIASLRVVVESSVLRTPALYIPGGCRVRISSGPLAGACGVMEEGSYSRKFAVSIALLQRSVLVQLDDTTDVTLLEDRSRIAGPLEERVAMALCRQ
jgi:transcription termination/antitermination protein NusG